MKKKEIKVAIKLKDDEHLIRGSMYLDEDKRLQDILNDDRRFLPVSNAIRGKKHIQNNAEENMIINKDVIATIVEQ